MELLRGVSLDGKEILRQVSPTDPPDGNGTIRGTCTLDLKDCDAFRGVRSFWVHMVQSNGSGVATNVSRRLERLEIDATPR